MSNLLSSFFCDDIRIEKDGRMSFIGVYGGAFIVPKFPFRLPQLCGVMKLIMPLASEEVRSFSFKLYLGEKIIVEHAAPENEIKELATRRAEFVQNPESTRRFQNLQTILRFSPFVVPEKSLLYMLVYINGDETRLPAVSFKLAPQ